MKAYGSEPVLLQASPVTGALAAGSRRKRRRTWALLLVLAVCLLLAGGWWLRQRDRGILPGSIRKAASYPLYSPGWLPPGTRLDPASVDATPQVVTFAFVYNGAKKLIFTEQPKPAGFDFDGFYNDQLTEKQAISLNLGQATTGMFEDTPFASVVAGRTWIIIRAPQNMDGDQFSRVVRSLRLE